MKKRTMGSEVVEWLWVQIIESLVSYVKKIWLLPVGSGFSLGKDG